jgi:tRNA C32,U32 (ribose-2'-O)-methylase TrmJ
MSDEAAKAEPKLTGEALELETTRNLVDLLTKSGIIEVAVRNPNVMSYMEHWEGRAEKAEAEVERLREVIRLCHDTMHETIAVLSFSDSQKVANVMEIARKVIR